MEHAAYAKETGWDDLCAGSKMAEPYEGEVHLDGKPVEIRGQWRASDSTDYPGHPRFQVDPIGDLTWYGVEFLRDSLIGVDNPRAIATRTLLARGAAEMNEALGITD